MFRDLKKYEIYEDGRIWSYSHNKWLKPYLRSNGYLRVRLSDNDNNVKSYYLHRIIYEAVTSQPIPEGLQVNHINEVKTDNRFENLNLMTPKENINFGTRNEKVADTNTNNKKLSKLVEQYDKEGNLIQIWPSTMEVQRQLGFNNAFISSCCRGLVKSAYGFIWRYLDSPTV